jgi:hypothetical protein
MADAKLNQVPCPDCSNEEEMKSCKTCNGLGFTYEMELRREAIIPLLKLKVTGTATSRPPKDKDE